MIQATLQRCAVHEQRPAFARCMACSTALCQSCATDWDGIWHCAACLAAKRIGGKQRSSFLGWVSVAVLAPLLLYSSARLMVIIGATLAGLF
jgi:hypothetical protein